MSGGYPPYNLVCNAYSGSPFTVGSHVVSYLAQDSKGNSTPTAEFTITVTAPVPVTPPPGGGNGGGGGSTGGGGTSTGDPTPVGGGNNAPPPARVPASRKGVAKTGNAKANTLVGTMFDDVLRGPAGNDSLSGKAGADWLYDNRSPRAMSRSERRRSRLEFV